jgi:hypothetical protein
MNPKHLPAADDLAGNISRITEESGEVLQAIGKIERFGLHSYHPSKGGLNNAAHMLSELADLRHAISVTENLLTDYARSVVLRDGVYRHDFVWTDTLITTKELRELVGDEDYDNDDEFNADHDCIEVCAGQWHREGLEWRFYVDSELD